MTATSVRSRELDYQRPAPGVERFTVPLAFASPDHLHVHVIETPDGPLMVDTGARGSEAALYAGLRALDREPVDVVLTHGHIDHWGLATLMTDTVLAHPGVEPTFRFVRDRTAPPTMPGAHRVVEVFEAFARLARGIPNVQHLADGDRLGAWTVLWTPGHDPGHLCLYREDDGVLLCGDLLLPGFTPNVQPSWTPGEDALADFLSSLDRVADLPVSLVLPAHGAPYTDAAGRAAELKAHHADRLDVLRGALDAGVGALEDLRDRIFAPRLATAEDQMLSLMETYAHLVHLLHLGDARPTDDGAWVPERS